MSASGGLYGGLSGVTNLVASSGNVANTTTNAVLAGAAGKLTYITGFEVTGAGSTAGGIINITLSLGTASLNYQLVIPAGIGTSIVPLTIAFTRPIAASAIGDDIIVQVPAFGLGSTSACVNAYGFRATANVD